MRVRRWFGIVAPVVVLAGLFMLTPKLGAARDEGCDRRALAAEAAQGRTIVAVSNGRLVDPAGRTEACAPQLTTGTGMLRHVATEPGAGTVIVADEAGDDTLVILDSEGTTRLDADGEVLHPAWSPRGDLVWAEDMQRLVVRRSNRTHTIAAPSRALAVFSPRFVGHSLLAVVAEGGRRVAAEDASLDNLWRYDLRDERWSRVTEFAVRGDRWSAIRTPVVAPDGSLLFVRVHGRWKRTRSPSFELWRSGPAGTERVTRLPGEMFLGGFHDGEPLWNVPTRRCGDWELFVESRRGLRSVGCGAIQVDPVDAPDPDLPAAEEGETAAAPQQDAEVAVLIGDFSRRSVATAVALRLRDAARVVTHADAPAAVRPGAFAVAVPADPAAPARIMRDVRNRFPGLASRVYLASL